MHLFHEFTHIPPDLGMEKELGKVRHPSASSDLCIFPQTCLEFLRDTVDLVRAGSDVVVYRAGAEEPFPSILLHSTFHELLRAGDSPAFAQWSQTG